MSGMFPQSRAREGRRPCQLACEARRVRSNICGQWFLMRIEVRVGCIKAMSQEARPLLEVGPPQFASLSSSYPSIMTLHGLH